MPGNRFNISFLLAHFIPGLNKRSFKTKENPGNAAGAVPPYGRPRGICRLRPAAAKPPLFTMYKKTAAPKRSGFGKQNGLTAALKPPSRRLYHRRARFLFRRADDFFIRDNAFGDCGVQLLFVAQIVPHLLKNIGAPGLAFH